MKHLNFTFTQNEVKTLEAERILDAMFDIIQDQAKEMHFSEANTKLYLQGFIKAIGRVVSLDKAHICNKDSWAISNEYV